MMFASIVFFVAFAGQALRYTFGWAGWGVIIGGVFLLSLYVYKNGFKNVKRALPYPLALFLLWCVLSVIWSQYKPETLLGITLQLAPALIAVLMAVELSWGQLLHSLSVALKWILGTSIVLEAYVSIFLRHALYPFVEPVKGYPWINGNFLTGDPIQGIVGNRNLLGFIALLGLIVFIIDFYQKRRPLSSALIWVSASVLMLVMTRSATITLAVFALIVLTALALVMRRLLIDKHKYMYYGAGSVLLILLALCVIYSSTLFSLVGRDEDLTGRTTIWRSVWHLAEQHILLGWGWVSYWTPWVEPFNNLAVLGGTRFLQAHNALLDLLFQTGIVGVVVALVVAVMASVRAWRMSIYPTGEQHALKPYKTRNLLPVLLMAELLIQSLTESRLLIEGNWLLFVLLCCKVKMDAPKYGNH